MSGPSLTLPLQDLLHRVFGHREFRAHQREVCEAAASGSDVLLVMPTGAGKSLCYQLPALARRAAGDQATALVISPLIALMDDQAAKLSALGLRVARIHSGLDRESSRQACRDYLTGELDFLFIAPERMRVPGFPEMLAKRKPALIAVDEAHCISQWGHDFRPDYRTVGQHLAALRPSPIIALTATATPAVQRDIVRQLGLRDAQIFITGFRRHNLAVEVLELSKPQRPEFTEKLLSDSAARPAIVYAPSRKSAEELATRLNAKFRAAAYHAGLEPSTRERVQREFLAGKLEVIVATIAFGMGVDKADIRTVVHVALPGSVEAFYQEIGRAGRDGNQSRSVLLYSFADRKTQEFLLERNYPLRSDLERVLRVLDEDFEGPDELAARLKLDRETLDRSVEKLITHGAALADFNGRVRALENADATDRWQDGYDAQVGARRRQIDNMMAFAEGSTCRMTALVEHFGDRSDPLRTCGLCDICQPSAATGSVMREASSSERKDLRAILMAAVARSTSSGKLFSELALTKDRKEFDALLDGLARAGLITLANDSFRAPDGRDVTYRKVSITHEGRTPDDETLSTVWLRESSAGSRSAGTTKKAKKATEDTSLSPAARELEEKLRRWRGDEAKEAGKPAFTIFHDSTLRAIANAAPRSVGELGSVPGIGPQKLDRYGAQLLALCREGSHGGESVRLAPEKPRNRERPQETPAQTPYVQKERPERGHKAEAMKTISTDTVVRQPNRPSGPRPVRESAPPPQPAELNAAQAALDSRLRAWRKEQAHAVGLPSFFIFSDTVLREIALAAPSSLADLGSVRGLGPEKVERFGSAVLELCRGL
jgi:ATP-dependent DNA helicase RecQ